MKIVVHHRSDSVAVIRLEGRLDFLSAVSAREQFFETVAGGMSRLVVDLGGVSFIDSSGLGSLVGGLKSARQAGGDLRIACPSDQAKSVLRLTSLDQVFRPHPTIDDALTAYERRK